MDVNQVRFPMRIAYLRPVDLEGSAFFDVPQEAISKVHPLGHFSIHIDQPLQSLIHKDRPMQRMEHPGFITGGNKGRIRTKRDAYAIALISAGIVEKEGPG